MIEDINKHTPDELKVTNIEMVEDGYDVKQQTIERQYCYVMPAWSLKPQIIKQLDSKLIEESGKIYE